MRLLTYVVALSTLPCLLLVLRKHFSLRGGERCEGIVAEHVPRSDSDGTTYALRIRYADARKREYTFVTSTSSQPASRAIGDRVTVIHRGPGKTADLIVFDHLYLWYWIWFCLGVFSAGCLAAPPLLRALYEQ